MKTIELTDIRGRIGDLLMKARSRRALFEALSFYSGGLADRIEQIYDGRDIPPAEGELGRLGKAITSVEGWTGQPRKKWMRP